MGEIRLTNKLQRRFFSAFISLCFPASFSRTWANQASCEKTTQNHKNKKRGTPRRFWYFSLWDNDWAERWHRKDAYLDESRGRGVGEHEQQELHLAACCSPLLHRRFFSHYVLSALSGLAARYFTYQRGNPTGSSAPLSPNTLIGSFSANLLPPKHCLGFN